MRYLAATPLCPLYAAPGTEAERVDEILTGWPVTGPEARKGDWWQVRTHYGYSGWVRQSWLVPDEGWTALPRMVVTAPFADVLVRPAVEEPVEQAAPEQAAVEPETSAPEKTAQEACENLPFEG